MTKQKNFFIYSREDGSTFALRLATDLKKKGFDVWIDQQDIRAGLEWDTEIEKALQSCDCLLFLETKKSVISNNVLDEVYYAMEKNKKVIPLIFVDSNTPFRLNRLQHIDFIKNYDTGFSQLVNELKGNTPVDIYPPGESHPRTAIKKLFNFKKYGIFFIIACIAVVVTTVIVVTTKNKNTTAPTKEDNLSMLLETVAGNWKLTDIDPKARSQNGYLKIEQLDENKANIKGFMQFYYPDGKDSSYLVNFNVFAGCNSCIVKSEMKLVVEDIAVGSRFVITLPEDQADGRKAGEIISDENYNKTIGGTVTLYFKDKLNAEIIVKQSLPIELPRQLLLKPFVYTYRFKKEELP